MAGDAMRIVDDRHRIAVEEGQRVAVQLVGGRTVEFEIARRRDHIGDAVLERLAGVARFQRREFRRIVGDRLAELHQQAAALERGEPSPGAFKRLARRRDRSRNILRAAARDAGEGAPVRGAKHVENAPIRRADIGPADDIGAEGQSYARAIGRTDIHGRLLMSFQGFSRSEPHLRHKRGVGATGFSFVINRQ